MTGNFARSLAGHDKDEIYVVISEKDNHVMLSDGRLKKVDKPKIKNKKHIRILKSDCSVSLLDKINNNDKALNEAIKRAIKLYKQEDENV